MDLCSKKNNSELFNYFARNFSERNCGCFSCIRRCCKPGFVYKSQFCYGNSTNFLEVPVYSNKTISVTVLSSIVNFVIGVPDCVLFRLDFPTEKFYVQHNTKDVWIPNYNKFYSNNQYCIDELNGFTPFLCFGNITDLASESSQFDELNIFGKNRF